MASVLSASLQLGTDVAARVSPVVPSVILDYFLRSRDDKQGYLVGTLLGYREGDTVFVRNCYGVPYEVTETENEDGEKRLTVKYDKDYDERMRRLLTRGTKEEVVGAFYVAAGQLKNGPETQGFWSYWQNFVKRNVKGTPLLLGLDPKYKEETESLGMRVHREHDYGLPELQTSLVMLAEVPFSMNTEEFREAGVEAIAYGQEHTDTLGLFTSKLRTMKDYSIEDLNSKQRVFKTSRLLEISLENLVSGTKAL
jgi:hypothetical protein